MRKTSLYSIFVFLLIVFSLYLIFLPSYYATPLFDFTLDDSYITYRYSENLASGAGPVWNPGEDPVEGYTSFLWMLVNAGFIKAGIDPELGSKILSLFCVVMMIGILAYYGKDGHPIIQLIAAAAIAFSPAFLLISIQGMETVFVGLLITTATLFYLNIFKKQKNGSIIGFFIFSFLSVLTRPDVIIYFLALSISLLVYLIWNKQRKLALRFILIAFCFFIVPGLIYFLWRWGYYGYMLPNTAYVKNSSVTFVKSGIISAAGVKMVLNFLTEMAAPYVIIFMLVLKGNSSEDKTPAHTPFFHVIFGVLSFLFAMCFFVPVQGFLYRYQMPFFPVILLLFVSILNTKKEVLAQKRGALGRSAVILLIIFLFCFPLHTREEVAREIENRWKYDRVVMGKGLAQFKEHNLTLMVSEAGALPYFSGWRTVDALGLNDEYIAHNGLDLNYLEEVNPDLVVIVDQIVKSGFVFSYGTIYDYLVKNDFELTAVVSKTTPFLDISNDIFHFYLVNKKGRMAQELRDFLLSYEQVKRVPVDSIMKLKEDYVLESLAPKE
jgi:hypothetical protein